MNDIPKRFRSQATDRYVNYIRCASDIMLHLELEFDTQLDFDRLAHATNLTLDAEPVLGCRFVQRWWRPYWERLDVNNRQAFIAANNEMEYESFKSSSIDPYTGPQLKACLWHSINGDRLLLKVAHEVADAGAVKEIASTISSIYTRLKNEPGYQPTPNINGCRSIWQVLRRVPVHAYPKIYFSFLRQLWAFSVPANTLVLPMEDGPNAPLVFAIRHIPSDRVSRMMEYAHLHNATLNDLLITASFHSLATIDESDKRKRLRLVITVDLRRYLPNGKGGGICNLSAQDYLTLGIKIGDNFDATLKWLSDYMRHRKANWIGIGPYLGMEPLAAPLPYKLRRTAASKQSEATKRNSAPNPTNMCRIDPNTVTFDVSPIKAYLLPPPVYPPLFVYGLSGYNGTLTLSAGTYPTQKEIVEKFFDAILKELPA